MTYIYEALVDSQIRVIQILEVQPVVNISLIHRGPDDIPEYTALSYTWGTEDHTEEIICNGQSMPVTPHLLGALVDIYSVRQSAYLWIDAISIDQANAEEKAEQVMRMYLIYQDATRVLVYLGPSADNSDEAMSAFDTAKDYHNPTRKTDDDRDIQDTVTHLKSRVNNMFHPSLFKPIAALGRRPWFGRLWTVQEYIFGKNVSIQCGRKILPAEDFSKVCSALPIYSFGGTEPPGFLEESDLFQGFHNLTEMNKIKRTRASNDGPSFFDMVMLGRDREAKEPVDKVYAAFGLAERSDAVYKDHIDLDYSEDNRTRYWNVYVEFGKFALAHESRLRLLSYSSSDTRPPELPSWCPNLNTMMKTSVMDPIYASGWPYEPRSPEGTERTEEQAHSHCSLHPNFRGKDRNHVVASPSNNVISVWGTIFDRIQKLTPVYSWIPDFDTNDLRSIKPFARSFLSWYKACKSLCSKMTGNEVAAIRTLEDVFVGASRGDTYDAARDPGEGRITVLLIFVELMLAIINLSDEISDQDEEYEARLKDRLNLFLAWIPIQHELWSHRLLFSTERGRLGWASEDVQVGDGAAMLYSGPVIYILRPSLGQNGGWELVSDAFVLGCMQGEIFDLLDSGEVRQENVCIR